MAQIIWTERAKFDYWSNIDYLERQWTLKEVYAFLDKVAEIMEVLAKENITFKPTKYKNTFQVPVTKQITLFYSVLQNKDIQLLSFWNTYQNPQKLEL
jgi:hypothetical protein